jgi:hypothetical protein
MFSIGRSRFDDDGREFWKWWPGARDRIANAIVTGTFDNRLVNEITKYVRRVHPEMAWELQPGQQASHAFCLSSEGDPPRCAGPELPRSPIRPGSTTRRSSPRRR